MRELCEAAAAARALAWAPAPSLDDLEAACAHFGRAELRVAVLGPFNQGKSTLLNAILGTRVLPVDILRATAGPIVVRNGPSPETRLLLVDGTRRVEPGFGLLARCTLTDETGLRGQVREVEVRLPHPVLARGVVLVDLPGTGDETALEEVVRRELLSADLVVQVLNGRQLLTMEERRILDEWVLRRGVGGVLFAVNFLNLLEEDEVESVWQRAAELAGEMEIALPPGPRVLRVDALPALRACVHGDAEAEARSGLTAFVDTLSAALEDVGRHRDLYRGPRLAKLAGQVDEELSAIRAQLDATVRALAARAAAEQAAAEARAARLRTRLLATQEALRAEIWALHGRFSEAAAGALARNRFGTWRGDTLVPWLSATMGPVSAVAAEVSGRPATLTFYLPADPSVSLPAPPADDAGSVGGSVLKGVTAGFLGGSIIPGPGHLIGAVMGGLVGLGRAEERKQEAARARLAYEQAVENAYASAAGNWLRQLANEASAALDTYVAGMGVALAVPTALPSHEEAEAARQLAALDAVLVLLRAAGTVRRAHAA